MARAREVSRPMFSQNFVSDVLLDPDQTRIVVSNNDEYVRVFDVDTRESAGKEWGSLELVGSVKLGTAANHGAPLDCPSFRRADFFPSFDFS